MVHIYFGDGKGKTTAAVGLAVRAAGHGKRVLVAQFLKDGTSGECRFLREHANIRVFACNPVGKFSFQMTDDEKNFTRKKIKLLFETIFGAVKYIDILVLDEVFDAIACGFLDETMVLEQVVKHKKSREMILTGRSPSETLCGQADYITEMVKIRHPYDSGISGREGIEW